MFFWNPFCFAPWEVDCEESWVPKNWCFWTVVLKTLESPLDCKEIQPVHSERDQPWDFFGRNDAKAEIPVLWPPHAKSWLIGKDSRAGRDCRVDEKGTTENEMAGWHHWLDECESEWTPGVGDGQGGLVCCDSCSRKEWDTTEQLNWTELKWWCPCVDSSLGWLERAVCYDQSFLGKTLLAFSLLNFVPQGQTCLLLQVSLDFLPLHFNPLWWIGHILVLILEGVVGLHRYGQLQLFQY